MLNEGIELDTCREFQDTAIRETISRRFVMEF